MSKKLLFRLVVLVAAMMCAQGASGQEAYACADYDYTSNCATLTFYYDNDRSSRSGATFELNAGEYFPGWVTSGLGYQVKYVVFDPSFAAVRPSSTYGWFLGMIDLMSITGLSYLNTSEVTNMVWMFSGCYSLTSLDLSSFNTSKVTSMEGMFQDCGSLTSLDLSSFNTSQVTNMEYMFSNCTGLTSVDLSSFNTSQVTKMEYMFNKCGSLTSLDLSSFNTSQVTSMKGMFNDCGSMTSVDLSSFNTSQVTNMEYMFNNCYDLIRLDLSNFNTSQVTEMSGMFFDCTSLRAIFVGSGWTTASVIDSSGMFKGCTSLVGGQGTTYDAKHVDATYAHLDGGPINPGYLSDKNVPMAYACYTPSNTTLTFYYDTQRSYRSDKTYSLNTGSNYTAWYNDETYENVTKVVFDPSFAGACPSSTCVWFLGMRNLKSITGLSYLNTSQVTNMEYMFGGCSALTSLDLGNFNTSQVTTMPRMFSYCTNLHTIYVGSGWSMANVTESRAMFDNCTSLVGGQGTAFSASHIDGDYAHIDGGPSNPGYFTDKNTCLPGDVNGDHEVNIADVNATIDIIMAGNGSTPAADVNGDGEINIADINAIIDIILGGTQN